MGTNEEHRPIIMRSKVTGKMYVDNENVVHLWNIQQIYAFLQAGAEIIDIFPGHDRNGEEKLCFVFSKDDFDLLQPLWKAHKL